MLACVHILISDKHEKEKEKLRQQQEKEMAEKAAKEVRSLCDVCT